MGKDLLTLDGVVLRASGMGSNQKLCGTGGCQPELVIDRDVETFWLSETNRNGGQWLEFDLGRPMSVVEITLADRVPRDVPMVSFRQHIRQPDGGRPAPTQLSLVPMSWRVTIQDLGQPYTFHHPDQEGNIINPFRQNLPFFS